MKRSLNWQVVFGIALLSLAAIFYSVHYILFKDARLIIKDFIEFTGLFFIQIMIATLVINKFLNYREKMILLKKMNMAIGVFYSEVGSELLKRFAALDQDVSNIANKLIVTNNWTDKEFAAVARWLSKYECSIDPKKGDLGGLKAFLSSKRDFLLTLLENPNLLEHESFTNLLWAVFHLMEELSGRKDLSALPAKDAGHLVGDAKRVYGLAILEWLAYMRHLKSDYPYLFSLAMRTNPFDANASIEVK